MCAGVLQRHLCSNQAYLGCAAILGEELRISSFQRLLFKAVQFLLATALLGGKTHRMKDMGMRRDCGWYIVGCRTACA